MLIAVTGASGFVGRAVIRRAMAQNHRVRAIVREGTLVDASETVLVPDLILSGEKHLRSMFNGVDAVIHLAARVHVLRETATDPTGAFMQANCDLTLRLAEAAAAEKIGRFVQVSSVAAIASVTEPGKVADDDTPPTPQNAYGYSKLAADRALASGSFGAMRIVSLRLPTIYGPGVGALFAKLMRCANNGVPLPIGGVANRRSFLFLENAADALVAAAECRHEGVYCVTDSPPIATADLYRALLQAAGRRTRIPSLPTGLVALAARSVLGGRAQSLLGSSAFDGARFARTFGWTPPVSFDRAICETVAAA
ncbi:NAD-dependent epimerase/dehydratase family protein [Sphingomonas baiyangensis]|uniref:NAD-dependent epimerase/dehydratase family protein n=1 Tax=Sphingomonas baiyangensis TaxID=2572576 RepID=A0A4U1L2B1_9SPHN|nr:NAD-dependent epimerase/dehydratase family protein [Sphingomonas baiyangensis]TKD50156.1 NAD-dependent epimerase/dehydratase family protein [Sphingomonas baiyangensis]